MQFNNETPTNVQEALELADLDWTVRMEKLETELGTPLTKHTAVVAEDNNTVLSVMKDRYKLIQNAAAFKIVDEILKQKPAKIITAGHFKNRTMVYMQVGFEDTFEPVPGDHVQKVMTIISSHDGSKAWAIQFSGKRLASNTYFASTDFGIGQKYTAYHTRISGIKPEAVKDILELAEIAYYELGKACEKLAKAKANKQKISHFTYSLFPKGKLASSKVNVENREQFQHILEHGQGSSIPGVQGTKWGLFNAACEYYDHFSKSASFERSLLYGGEEFRKKILKGL